MKDQIARKKAEWALGTAQQALSAVQGGPVNVSRTLWVNPAIGNDNNDGSANDAAHALKTIGRANQRIGMGRSPNLDGLTVVVNYVGATCSEDVYVDANLGGNGSYALQFNPVVVRSGTIDAVNFPLSGFSAGEDITIHDALGLDWSTYTADQRFRIDVTSGTGAGFHCFVMKSLGGGAARVTYLAKQDPATPATGINQYAPTVPFTYNIVQLPYVTGAIIDAVSWGAGPTVPTVPYSRFSIQDCAVERWVPLTASLLLNGYVNFYCPESVLSYATNVVIGQVFINRSGHEVDLFSGGFLDTIYTNDGYVSCDEGPILQAISVQGDTHRPSTGTFDIHERSGIFDLASPIIVQGERWVIGDNGIYGNGSTSAIFQINPRRELVIYGGAVLATTTTAPVEVTWGDGNGGTVSQARPYTAATDTLGALGNTTFANISTNLAAGGYRRNDGSAIILAQ